MTEKRKGRLLVLSGPSATGKTTLARLLLKRHGGSYGSLVRSVSVTTRPCREGEVEGADYEFLTENCFAALLAEGELLEHAELYGCRYGTRRAFVEDSLNQGRDVLLILDTCGRRQLTDRHAGELISVFLLPPSLDELEKRLRGRNRDSEEAVVTRLTAACDEIARCSDYDYVLRNHELNATLASLERIFRKERR